MRRQNVFLTNIIHIICMFAVMCYVYIDCAKQKRKCSASGVASGHRTCHDGALFCAC